MRRPAIFLQALAWAALWGFWVVALRHNHPSLQLKAIASGSLVAAFAAAVYANRHWLIPGLWRERRYAVDAAALLLVVALLALACTAAIHVMYDILWGPDPARFGFRANLGMEFGLVAIHVLLIAAVIRLFERARARSAYETMAS
jgi:hypothetical protein